MKLTAQQAWAFTSYEKIAESPERLFQDEATLRLLEKAQWVVMEKIHGANFCFLTDGREVRCASRKQMLGPRDDFFGYQAVAARLRQKILDLCALVKASHPEASGVLVYGELFGGGYPHPDVPPDLTVQPIQTGIFYAPSIEFCAFDLAIEASGGERTAGFPTGSGGGTAPPRTYLDYDSAMRLFEQAGLFYARPLLIGSFQEALNYPLGFASTIPKLLGLPLLPTENKAEGVVIKPLKTILLPGSKGPTRPLLKRKIAEFDEDKRYQQAEKWTPRPITEQSALDLLTWEAFNLVTANRLQSAISKAGALSAPQQGRGVPPVSPMRGQANRQGRGRAQQVFRLLVEDVLEQLGEQHEAALAALTPAERAQLTESIRQEVRALMKKHFTQR
jgi:Rnl2 family RNA ligase